MTHWKGAWFLAKHEIRRSGWCHLLSLAFIGYVLLFTSPSLANELSGDSDRYSSWLIDFLYMSMLPVLGFIMSRSSMGYWRTDTYSQKLAAWRTMPIHPRQIILGRILQVGVTLAATHLLFFAAQYAWISTVGPDPGIGEFILHGLFWLCYSMIMSTFYIAWETGHSGKIYFIFCCVIVAVMLVLVGSLGLMGIGSVSMMSMHLIERGLVFILPLMLAAAIFAVVVGTRIMTTRLQSRNYLN